MASKKKKRSKGPNRRGGSGRGCSPASAEHVKESLIGDCFLSAESSVKQHGIPESPKVLLEVLPGIPSRAFVPELGRMAEDHEVTAILNKCVAECSEIDVPRSDRPEKTRPDRPAGAIEFSHGQLRIDCFLALRWGQQEGLPSPNAMFDAILLRVSVALKEKYGDGLLIWVAALHLPNPFLEEALKAAGWRGSISNPSESDKIGAWNIHLQVYVGRVKDRKLTVPRGVFSHASDSVISSMQLRSLGVDLDEHRTTKFETQRTKSYYLAEKTAGKKGKKLPGQLRKLVTSGKLSFAEAVAKAVATDLKRKDESWAAAKGKVDGKQHSGNLVELNKRQVQDARDAKAIDLFLAEWFTKEVERELRLLHPRYVELLDKAPGVFRELKRQQMDGGHRVLLNEILTQWERDQQAKKDRIREVEIPQDTGKEYVEIDESTTGHDEETDLAPVELLEEMETVSPIDFDNSIQRAMNAEAEVEKQRNISAAQEARASAAEEGLAHVDQLREDLAASNERVISLEKQIPELANRLSEAAIVLQTANDKHSKDLTESINRAKRNSELGALLKRRIDLLLAIKSGFSPAAEHAAELGFFKNPAGKWVYDEKEQIMVIGDAMKKLGSKFIADNREWAAAPVIIPEETVPASLLNEAEMRVSAAHAVALAKTNELATITNTAAVFEKRAITAEARVSEVVKLREDCSVLNKKVQELRNDVQQVPLLTNQLSAERAARKKDTTDARLHEDRAVLVEKNRSHEVQQLLKVDRCMEFLGFIEQGGQPPKVVSAGFSPAALLEQKPNGKWVFRDIGLLNLAGPESSEELRNRVEALRKRNDTWAAVPVIELEKLSPSSKMRSYSLVDFSYAQQAMEEKRIGQPTDPYSEKFFDNINRLVPGLHDAAIAALVAGTKPGCSSTDRDKRDAAFYMLREHDIYVQWLDEQKSKSIERHGLDESPAVTKCGEEPSH